ncbi:hypothetical protein JCM5350_006528 [Sporobolomyces pararoseus]
MATARPHRNVPVRDFAAEHAGRSPALDQNQPPEKRPSNATSTSSRKKQRIEKQPLAPHGSSQSQIQGGRDGGAGVMGRNEQTTASEEREKARADAAEQRLEAAMRQLNELRTELANYRDAHPEDDNPVPSSSTSSPQGTGRTGKSVLTPQQRTIHSRIKHRVYFDYAFVDPRMFNGIFSGDRGEGEQARIYDDLVQIFGSADKLKEPTSQTIFNNAHHRAFTEAAKRVKDELANITNLDNATLKDKKSNQVQDLLGEDGTAFLWHTRTLPRLKFCQSQLLIETISALIHGPSTLHAQSAALRASSQASTKFRNWRRDEKCAVEAITANLAAFAASLLYHHLRGFKRFKFDQNPESKNHKVYAIFVKVANFLATNTDGPAILRRLTSRLIPEKAEDEDEVIHDFEASFNFDSRDANVLGESEEDEEDEEDE